MFSATDIVVALSHTVNKKTYAVHYFSVHNFHTHEVIIFTRKGGLTNRGLYSSMESELSKNKNIKKLTLLTLLSLELPYR